MCLVGALSSDRADNLAGVDIRQALTGTVGRSPEGILFAEGSMLGKATEGVVHRWTLRPRGGLQTSSHLGAIRRSLPVHCC